MPQSGTVLTKSVEIGVFQGVGHFENKFLVDGDVARNPSMDRQIENDVATTLPLDVFTKKNFSGLFATEV